MANQQCLNELALFAGAGGGILGGKLLGWNTVCAVEWEPYPASVLCARQNDGLLPPFPIWDDVQTFDGKPWRGIVDVVSGGFPCQDISAAGKGAGIDGERSGMWREMARIICEVRPKFVFVENSPMLTSRGLGTVLGDLASMGFNAKWGLLGADSVGAPHKRDRIWIAAKQREFLSHSKYNGFGWGKQQQESTPQKVDAYAGMPGLPPCTDTTFKSRLQALGEQSWRGFRSGDRYTENARIVCGVNDGMAARVDRLKAIGNGQVSLCAAAAWRVLTA